MSIAIVSVGLGAYFLPKTTEPPQLTTYDTYRNTELGLEFTYATGTKGYILEESTPRQDPNTYASLILTQKGDYLNLKKNPPRDGEGPPTISIAIFENLKKEELLRWAETHIQYSNLNLKNSPISNYELAGRTGLRYQGDGLYPFEIFITSHERYIYVLTGTYLEERSAIRNDFLTLMQSVRFIPIAKEAPTTPAENDTVILGIGETKKVGDLSIKLVSIDQDSRCPLGVTCIWVGEVVATFSVMSANTTTSLTLRGREAVGSVGDYEITMLNVAPAKIESREIKKEDYRTTVKVHSRETLKKSSP